MSQTSASAATAGTSPGAPAAPGRARRALRATAIVSCVPYLALKAAWVAGSRLGIPDGSPLLEHRTTMAVANSLSIVLDSAVVVLALLLTRPWGLRVPAWLLAFPMWVATGLIAPIMTGYPLQLLVRVVDGGARTSGTGGGGEPFLDEWVFGVVYTGFIVQGLTLGTLFVLYARDRWRHLWSGRTGDLPVSAVAPAQRATAVAAAVLALFPLAQRAAWACGSTAGLSGRRAMGRDSDFHVLEATFAAFLVVAVAGAWMLAFRQGRGLSLKVPLALAWTGSGATACWGCWVSLASLGGGNDLADRPTQAMNLTYAGQMIVGILVAALGAHFLAERAAAGRAARRPV
ncbi:hypothetical protein ACFY93_27440 [Streptomyces sp. NPDC008313]|uniref:hypothetical protein n=1 Tax=Streptomyces sp. NPDC008313 TaxID=3364826 RepID=UPI0036F11535